MSDNKIILTYVLVVALLSIGMIACEKVDPSWGEQSAIKWAKAMGEENPKVYCQVYGGENHLADCSVKVGNRVYALKCYYHLNQTCEQKGGGN